MPTLNYQVEATGVNILKTVTDEVISGLLEELDLTRSFENAIYPMSSFMAVSDYSNGNGQPKMTTNRCDVEANYILDKSQVPWPTESPYTTAALGRKLSHRGIYTPILADAEAGILIEHQTIACAIELRFDLSFTTFDEACKAFDRIQSRYKGSLVGQPFHLAFSYPVSFDMMKYLTSVFQAKTAYKNKKFMDWINDTKKTEISWDVRKSELDKPDADKELMIRCQQLNCLMQLVMEQREPDVSRVESLPDIFKVSFVATIQFGRPSIISVHTPVSVDNTVLPETLFSSINYQPHWDHRVAGVYQDLTCNEFMRRSYGNFNLSHQLVRMPAYDDWLSLDRQYLFYQYRPFLVAHFTLDGPETIIDLKDLYPYNLHPVVKAIMTETGDSLLDYGGLFNIGVYADELKLGRELLSMDDDLKLKIKSNRKDKVYHLVISETTQLSKTDATWDHLLVKYRYFFPMTIERNLKTLIDKKYFYIGYNDDFLSFLSKLSKLGKIKALLGTMVGLGEANNEIYAHTQNVTQLADYLMLTPSLRTNYSLPTGSDAISESIRTYYTTEASVESRSLFVAFMEVCLRLELITLNEIPTQYLDPNRDIYPYYSGQGGFYGFNTPFRIINYTINT